MEADGLNGERVQHDKQREQPRGFLGTAFGLHGSVLPRGFIFSMPSTLLAIVLHLAWNKDTKGEDNPQVGGFMAIWGGYTFVLGFLIVFRNNQAYNRFWEAASKMHELRGELFNCASTLCAYCCEPTTEPAKQQVEEFQHLLIRLMSLLFSSCCHDIASEDPNTAAKKKSSTTTAMDGVKAHNLKMQVMDLGGMCEQSLYHLNHAPSRCEVISQWIYRLIVQKAREEVVGNPKIKVLDVPPPILGRPLADLASALADVYRARKIAEIPFPFPYAQMILDMLLVFSIVTPVLASQLVSSTAMAALATFCVTAGYWALFHIADEIDQPFGMDPNDLKLNNMQQDFNASLKALLAPQTQTVPSFSSGARLHRLTTIEIGPHFPPVRTGVWPAKHGLGARDRPQQVGAATAADITSVDEVSLSVEVSTSQSPEGSRSRSASLGKKIKKKKSRGIQEAGRDLAEEVHVTGIDMSTSKPGAESAESKESALLLNS